MINTVEIVRYKVAVKRKENELTITQKSIVRWEVGVTRKQRYKVTLREI